MTKPRPYTVLTRVNQSEPGIWVTRCDVTLRAGGKVDGQNGDPVPELQMHGRKKRIPAETRLMAAQTHPLRR